jgi:hypothetical protein
MANNGKKVSGMKMPGDIKVLPDKKPETKPAQAAAPKPMFNSRWRMLGGNPQKKD